MRWTILILCLIAAGKLGSQEYLFRTGTRDALVTAYADQAREACRARAILDGDRSTSAAWTTPASIDVVIGRSGLDVYPWQTSHALWAARYRNPYLIIVPSGQETDFVCEFDVSRGVASVHRSTAT